MYPSLFFPLYLPTIPRLARTLQLSNILFQLTATMMTMTELFYGPIEPTWIVHPQYQLNAGGVKRQHQQQLRVANPYLIYEDDPAFTYRSNPYMQQNVVPYNTNMVTQEGNGAVYPYQAHYFVANAPAGAQNNQKQQQQQVQSPARANVLQPRNNTHIQTVHFMVPLCCEKCEERVKNQLLDLDDVQRVSCNQWQQKVTVTSSVAAEKLLARLQKIKKRSTFWPQQQGALNAGKLNQLAIQQQQNQKITNENDNDE